MLHLDFDYLPHDIATGSRACWPEVPPPLPTPSAPPPSATPNEPDKDEGDEVDEPSPSRPSESITLTHGVYQSILDAFKHRQPEAAGLLLGPKGADIVTHFLEDETGEATPVSFTLDHASLNRQLKPYLACGLDAKGVVHLHPSGVRSLSGGDLVYARAVFANPKNRELDQFLMPVVVDGGMRGFVIRRGSWGIVVRVAELVLV